MGRHVWEDRALYRGPGRALRRIDAERVKHGAERNAAAILLDGLARDPSLGAGFMVLK